MTSAQILISIDLLIALGLFVWGKWRHDIVALITLVFAVVVGLVPSAEAFVGFGHPAVITVMGVLIISHALKNAGVVETVAAEVGRFTRQPLIHILSLTLVTTVASAFMNNVGALALMLPVALATAEERGRSPAMLLMPLAFGSILGGMTTLVGTPPNIIIANYRADLDGEAFSMFDFSAVGVLVAVVGVLFVTLIGWRLIPKERLKNDNGSKLFEISNYLTEVRVLEHSNVLDMPLKELDFLDTELVDLVGIAGERRPAHAPDWDASLKPGDILLLRADPVEIKPLIEEHDLELVTSATASFLAPDPENEQVMEGVVSRESPLLGRQVDYIRRRSGHTLALIGLARQGRVVRKRLRKYMFRPGDVLLLLGDREVMDSQFALLGLWPLAKRPLRLFKTRRLLLALGIFVVAIALGIAGVVSLPIAFIMAVIAYVITGVLSVRELYEEVDWGVVVLLGAMIPVGRALETTGTTELIADSVIQLSGDVSAIAIITILLVVTMFLSDIINNAATTLVMAPIGVAIANSLNLNTDTFLMAVAVGASCAFLTPIGHQSNTLVMGPGGYQFGDYWRMGLPLEILIVIVSVPALLFFWPL